MKQIDLITQGAGTGESYIADARICNTLKAPHCKAPPMVCYAAGFISRQGKAVKLVVRPTKMRYHPHYGLV